MGEKSYVSTLARLSLWFQATDEAKCLICGDIKFQAEGIKELFDSTKTLFLSTELF